MALPVVAIKEEEVICDVGCGSKQILRRVSGFAQTFFGLIKLCAHLSVPCFTAWTRVSEILIVSLCLSVKKGEVYERRCTLIIQIMYSEDKKANRLTL